VAKPQRRMNAAARREQILRVTLEMVAQHGVAGATMSRIATACGVTQAAIYTHFKNRKELFIAAIDVLYEKPFARAAAANHPDVRQRVRKISEEKYLQNVEQECPLLEFMVAPKEEGLRDAVTERQVAVAKVLEGFIWEGKQQGTVRPEVDPRQASWQLISWGWTDDISCLMGLRGQWESLHSLDVMLDSIFVPEEAVPPKGRAETPVEALVP
jgi:AcrR family transcriptional regulator